MNQSIKEEGKWRKILNKTNEKRIRQQQKKEEENAGGYVRVIVPVILIDEETHRKTGLLFHPVKTREGRRVTRTH